MSNDTVSLRCTAAFTLDGRIVRPGEVVEVTPALAANLLHRGRAELADGEEGLEQPAVLGTQTTPAAKKGRKPRKAEADDADDGDAEGDDA